MKSSFHRIAAWLTAIVLIALLATPIAALGVIDPNQAVSFSISYRVDGKPIQGVRFSVYQIASMNEQGSIRLTEPFSTLPVRLPDGNAEEEWRILATTLEGYIQSRQMMPTDVGTTDASGALSFPNEVERLPHGVYLVLGEPRTIGSTVYLPTPSIVMLPGIDALTQEWTYDIPIEPKTEIRNNPVLPEQPVYTMREVIKEWKDDGHQSARPSSITVQLLRNGILYDTVTLSEANQWHYTWEQLDNWASWTLTEQVPAGYTVTVEQKGITFLVTNTFGNDASNPSQTTGSDIQQSGSTPPGETSGTPPTTDASGASDTPTTSGTPGGSEVSDPSHPSTSVPGDRPQTTPDSPNLPQTGMLWWPVPVFAVVGCLCLMAGVLIARHHHE